MENAFFELTGFSTAQKKAEKGVTAVFATSRITSFTTFPGSTESGCHAFSENAHRAPVGVAHACHTGRLRTAHRRATWAPCPLRPDLRERPSPEMYGKHQLWHPFERTLKHICAKPTTICCPLYELRHNIYKEAIQCL